MKLQLQCVRNNGGRLGKLTEVGRNHGSATVDTPSYMLYTRLGSVPHISGDTLTKLHNVPPVVQMPLTLIAQYQEHIAGFKEGLGKFAALPDHQLVFTSVYDPAVKVNSGFNDNSGVGVFGRAGKVKLDVEGFMKVQEAVLPDWFQCMADCDTNSQSGRKRARKSVDRTLKFLDEILDRHKKSERLKDTCIFGTLVGGYDLMERERSVKETVARNVDGFILDGFHSMGPKSQQFSLKDVKDLVKATTQHLPEEKPRLMFGVWRPDALLHAITMGIDMFDASYPYVMTEQGRALAFDYRYQPDPEKDEISPRTQKGFTINLHDSKYSEEFSPLVADCQCYTCTNFTCAYINHLLNTSELLASTLLMIHNLHHYDQFFSQIRQALADDQFEDLKNVINKQIEIKEGS